MCALTAAVPHGELAGAATLTTTLNPHPGGASVQVHAREGASFRLLFDAVVTSGEPLPELVVSAPVKTSAPMETLAEVVEDAGDKWDPNGSQSLDDRLKIVVAESMGYSPEDLPAEVPLIELGLDSLMAMRIKNRRRVRVRHSAAPAPGSQGREPQRGQQVPALRDRQSRRGSGRWPTSRLPRSWQPIAADEDAAPAEESVELPATAPVAAAPSDPSSRPELPTMPAPTFRREMRPSA